MIAKQKPSEPDPSPKKTFLPHAGRASWLDAKLDAVATDAFRFRWFMIASGVVALAWVGFVGAIVLRPDATPKAAAAAPPPLLSTAPALLEEASLPPSQASEPGRLSGSEAPQDASDQPPVWTTTPAAGSVPLPRARKTAERYEAPPAAPPPKLVVPITPPPAKPITVTVRIFHPPVISSWYKDMVADKMKEQGLDGRLEAKVRSGQQLTKEDLASIPKPTMERINKQVVAYGQPPLYTDTTTTVFAAR